MSNHHPRVIENVRILHGQTAADRLKAADQAHAARRRERYADAAGMLCLLALIAVGIILTVGVWL